MMSLLTSGVILLVFTLSWTKMNSKEIFEKLVQKAYGWSWRLSSSLRRKPVGKPGELVAALSTEEREELMNLTSKDTDVSKHNLMYIHGEYPENTTTIHTHSVKKDDQE
jgi:hypothetical protein